MTTTNNNGMNLADINLENDVFFDVEVETADASSDDVALGEGIPTFKDAFTFLFGEAKGLISEYATPFNILMAKVAVIVLVIVISLGSVVSGIVKAHIAREQKKQAEIEAQLAAEEAAKREEKRQAVIAGKEAVLGKWYEMDASRDDIRTLLIEVDDDANCVYTIGDETGSFSFSGARLSLAGSESGTERLLILEDEQLKDETNGVSYYKTNANIKSLKFAEFLKNSLPGTYQEWTGEYLYIYPDGTWKTYHSWVGEHNGTWYMEINEGSVSFIFEGMGVHYGGGNIYKVTEDEYDSEKAEISSGDFSLGLDVNTYDRITSKLP